MQRDDVRLGEQLVQLHIAHGIALEVAVLVHVVGEHLHAQRLAAAAQRLADAAVAHDAHGAPGQLDALVRLLLPAARAHGVPGGGDVARDGEHVPKRELRHGVGAGARRIAHGDALLLGVGHVDVVHAHAAADDELEAARRGRRVDVRCAHLRCRAHDEHVARLHGLLERLGLIELADHLAALLLERGDGALLHAVGCQNTDHSAASFLTRAWLQSPSETRPAPPRPPWAWRCRSRRAGRRRSCGP